MIVTISTPKALSIMGVEIPISIKGEGNSVVLVNNFHIPYSIGKFRQINK